MNEVATREEILHLLCEAAELEHSVMCTYLYAAFSLKDGEQEGLRPTEAAAVSRWRRAIHQISREEMGHLVAVWNIAAALGGSPYFGRGNFPLDAGWLPASIVLKLAPFSTTTLQHFIYLERPADAPDTEAEAFAPEHVFRRGVGRTTLTPMSFDYKTVGAFYEALERGVRDLVSRGGEAAAFCGDPALQLAASDAAGVGTEPVICLKSALAALSTIVTQGEGAPSHTAGSHYQLFLNIRDELDVLRKANPDFEPSFPAATNPVLRPPPRGEGRVWIEHEEAAKTVDIANAAYGLMLRLLAYSYGVPRASREKQVTLDLSIALMHAFTPLAEKAARLPARATSSECNAGVSFTTLWNAAAFPPGAGARRAFIERTEELAAASAALDMSDRRNAAAARVLDHVQKHAARGFAEQSKPAVVVPSATPSSSVAEPDVAVVTMVGDIERVAGSKLTIVYAAKKCIHARFCVTGGPKAFLANQKGPWIHPDAMPVDGVVEIAHACPSGAIQYERTDGGPQEVAPPVNLAAVRENGPYAMRGDLRIDGEAVGFRATLCRCGASKNKPYCDSSHRAISFAATGEPETQSEKMLEVRDGPLEIDPQLDGPLQIRGNLEVTAGTGRVVARLQQARLCRCGASETKPFCDNSHLRIGFRSTGTER